MSSAESKKVSVRYFALFREQRGLSDEVLNTSAATLSDLYRELSSLYRFSLPIDKVRVAVNDEFCDWQNPIEENAKVVFIPPVAGG